MEPERDLRALAPRELSAEYSGSCPESHRRCRGGSVALGIHVEDVSAIIHYDLPADHQAYLHRSGRAARAGKDGIMVSLAPPDLIRELRHMQRRPGLRQAVTDVDLTAIQSLDREGTPSQTPQGSRRSKPATYDPQEAARKPGRPTSKKSVSASGAVTSIDWSSQETTPS